MTTRMHRLQISLPEWQYEHLKELASRRGVSIAEMVRRLVAGEAETEPLGQGMDSLWDIVGIVEDHGRLVNRIPVSERPELYLTNDPTTAAPASRQGGR